MGESGHDRNESKATFSILPIGRAYRNPRSFGGSEQSALLAVKRGADDVFAASAFDRPAGNDHAFARQRGAVERNAEAAEDGSLQEAFDGTAGEFIERAVTPLEEPRGCDT